jgi:hypothetical protein
VTESLTPDYPASDLDRPGLLLKALGSFWSDVFAGQSSLLALLQAKTTSARASQAAANRLADCRSRFSVPVYRVEPCWPVTMDPAAPRAAVRYGAGRRYGDGTLLGQPPTGEREQVPGNGFLGSPLLLNSVHAPTQILVEGVDYQTQSDGSLRTLDSLSGTYWACDALFDDRLPYLHVGSVAQLALPTSAAALALANAIQDAAINGPSRATLIRAVEALAGCSVEARGSAVAGETVEAIGSDQYHQLIITDQSVYRVPLGSVVAVSVDQILLGGETLSDAVRLVEAPDLPEDVTTLTLPTAFLDPSLSEPVTFVLADTALSVTTGVSGKTKLSWSGTGSGGAAFFDLLHQRGVAAGATLANYLDVRPLPRTGEPTALNLPATVSPLELLTQEVWRNRLVLPLLVKVDLLGEAALLDLDWSAVLRKLVAPHATVLVVEL